MDAPASLDRLVDIVVPAPVPFWPPSGGWYFLAVLIAMALILATLLGWRRQKRNRYRRQALATLRRVQSGPDSVLQVAEIIRRAALAGTSRRVIARLHGEDWVDWLVQQAPGYSFSETSRQLLASTLYSGDEVSPRELSVLKQEADGWIRKHRIQPSAGDRSPFSREGWVP